MDYLLKLTAKSNHQDMIIDSRIKISQILIQKSEFIRCENLSKISNNDLKLLFEVYDCIFFDNWFRDNFKGQIKFSLSKRMSRSAGLTICPKNLNKLKLEDVNIEIRFGINLLLNYNETDRMKMVSGISSKNSLEALQLVFEHEICHVIEFLLFHKSSCKRKRFKAIAHNLFRHTESYHKLPTYKELACKELGLNLGEEVSFISEGKEREGILYNIRKRATVMVKDKKGAYRDKGGTRYTKYNVSLSYLKQKK